jgi:hypothetical protein
VKLHKNCTQVPSKFNCLIDALMGGCGERKVTAREMKSNERIHDQRDI